MAHASGCTLEIAGRFIFSGTKNQPKEEVLGMDLPRTSGGYLRGYPGPKLRSGRSKYWTKKKQAFGRGHP